MRETESRKEGGKGRSNGRKEKEKGEGGREGEREKTNALYKTWLCRDSFENCSYGFLFVMVSLSYTILCLKS